MPALSVPFTPFRPRNLAVSTSCPASKAVLLQLAPLVTRYSDGFELEVIEHAPNIKHS